MDSGPIPSYVRIDELPSGVREAFGGLLDEVHRIASALEQSQARLAELERLADEDPLLDILNRRAFLRELARAMALVQRHGLSAAFAYIDVDGLKLINDRHGHAAGDAALRHIVTLIRGELRHSDALGRLGGDEFGLLLMQADLTQAAAKMNFLAEMVEKLPIVWDGVPLTIRFSWGLDALLDADSPEDLIERADQAMYLTRRQRRTASPRLVSALPTPQSHAPIGRGGGVV